MLLSRLTVFVLSLALLGDVHAQALPTGGGLDAARVLEQRYGQAAPAKADAAPSKADAAPAKGRAAPAPAPAPAPVRAQAMPGALATISFENTGKQDQSDVPVTFGQVFGVGELASGEQLQAKLAGGSALPLQADVKARHPDGSVRHAVVSLVLDRLAQDRPAVIGLFAAASKAAPAAKPAALPAKSLDARFEARIGQAFRASMPEEARDLPCESAEMAAFLKVKPGQMTGYSDSVAGSPSNMQPALAYAADVLGEPGRKAWRQFMARSVKPNYGEGAQFAIVPRAESAEEVLQR